MLKSVLLYPSKSSGIFRQCSKFKLAIPPSAEVCNKMSKLFTMILHMRSYTKNWNTFFTEKTRDGLQKIAWKNWIWKNSEKCQLLPFWRNFWDWRSVLKCVTFLYRCEIREETNSQCLKIIKKVSFYNIASEASDLKTRKIWIFAPKIRTKIYSFIITLNFRAKNGLKRAFIEMQIFGAKMQKNLINEWDILQTLWNFGIVWIIMGSKYFYVALMIDKEKSWFLRSFVWVLRWKRVYLGLHFAHRINCTVALQSLFNPFQMQFWLTDCRCRHK